MNIGNGKPIEITDKKLFDQYFQKYPPVSSEFTFTNLFMWRNYYNLLFLEFEEHLILYSNDYLKTRREPIKIDSNDYIYFFPPIGPSPAEIIIKMFEEFNYIEVHRVPEEISTRLIEYEKFAKLKLDSLEDRNNWDYVYNKEEILNLAGNKYRQNRRWLNKFLTSYEYEFQIITEDLIDKCKELQLEWCIMRACTEDESLEAEQEAIYEALNNFSVLGFNGGLICVQDKCAAYTFGEMLNEKTLVIHIEKAHANYEGAYQAINNFFLKYCCADSIYVNSEQNAYDATSYISGSSVLRPG
ncbi:MAG: DUF2156 domain-containing protein, partial [Promethearchaeota archaeon]